MQLINGLIGTRPALGYALIAVLLAGFGGLVGWRWAAGAYAMRENTQLRADAKDWAHIAAQQRQLGIDQAVAFDAAIARLNIISRRREDDRDAIRALAKQLDERLARAVVANPAWRDLDLGADFLRHWNEANVGPDAASAPAERASESDAAVSGAASALQRITHGSARAARPGSDALPRLPQRERTIDRSDEGMACDRVDLVLPGRHLDWTQT